MNDEIKQIKAAASLLVVAQKTIKLDKRADEWWGCCPFHSEKTPSFAIKVKNNEQLFYCQGCGKGGDVIRFVEYIHHCTTKQAIERLKADFGIGNAEYREAAQQVQETFHKVGEDEKEKPKVTFPLSDWEARQKKLSEAPDALAWLLNERGITAETASLLQLGYCKKIVGHLGPDDEHVREKGWIMYPRIIGDKVVAVKMRSIVSKAFSQMTHMDPKALFNLQSVNELTPVYVTEGELDTAIFVQAGYSAVSVPNAQTKLTPEAKIALKKAPCIFLAGDNDGDVGNACMKKLQRELGENAFMIVWPKAKDANEFFLKNCNGDIEEFKKQVEELSETARNTPVEGFVSLLKRLRTSQGTDAKNDPARLHFPKMLGPVDDMNYSPAGSVVVIYSTYSGTGKTVFSTQLALYEASRGEVVVVFSPELRDEAYLALIASQVVGGKRKDQGGLPRDTRISREDYEETARTLDTLTEAGTEFEYYVGHSLPVSESEEVMDFVENTIRVTGATRFIIDTLHRVTMPNGHESQTEAEGRIIKRLEKIGEKYGTIFILIGQSNKEAEDLKEARRDEYGVLRGSRELIDVAYGIYLLHRKRKAREDKAGILEDVGELVLMKDRGKGPGPTKIPLLYQKKYSTFVLHTTTEQDQPPGTDSDFLS